MSQFMSNNSIINFNDSTLEVCFLSFFGKSVNGFMISDRLDSSQTKKKRRSQKNNLP